MTFSVLCLVSVSGIAGAYEYESMGRRDPFVPLVGITGEGHAGGINSILTVEDVSLQGIVVGPDNERNVIINGELLKKGDKRERLSVESIGNNVQAKLFPGLANGRLRGIFTEIAEA